MKGLIMVEKTLLPSTIELTSAKVPVIHSIVSSDTKSNILGIIIIASLMWLFIPSESSHWMVTTAWWCCGPVLLIFGLISLLSYNYSFFDNKTTYTEFDISWSDYERCSTEMKELKSKMLELGYTTLVSGNGLRLPDSAEIYTDSLIVNFPRTIDPVDIGIFSHSRFHLCFHGLTRGGKELKKTVLQEIELSKNPPHTKIDIVKIFAEHKRKERERQERERKEHEREAKKIEADRKRKAKEELERKKREREAKKKETDRRRKEKELADKRKEYIENYLVESEMKGRYNTIFCDELKLLFQRAHYHKHDFSESGLARTINQQFWEPLGKPKSGDDFPIDSVWMLRQIDNLTPKSILQIKEKINSWKKGIIGEMNQHLSVQIARLSSVSHLEAFVNLMNIWKRCSELERAVEITDRLFQISPKSLDENDFEYVLSDMGIERQ